MKVHLRPIAPTAAGVSQADHLAWLAGLDPDVSDTLVADPAEADAILLTDAPPGPRLAAALLTDPFVRAHRDRLYLFTEDPRPWRVLPGLFTSLPRRRADPRTTRAMAYPCWTGSLNPHVHQEASTPPERAPDLLYSFAGRASHRVRRRLLRVGHDPIRTVVVDTSSSYDAWGGRGGGEDMERRYVELALRSRFALCPRGWATSTLRVYEMMALGVAPVIVADAWVPPPGPDWNGFALFVAEREVDSLPELLEAHASGWRDRGEAAFRAFRAHFAPRRQFRTLVRTLESLVPVEDTARHAIRRRWPHLLPLMSLRGALRSLAERIVPGS